jgi:phosphopantothenoylcysteine decarboxylase/phosphopantothenate--cysteine ligase
MAQGRRIVVGVGGGIAAYKVCEIVSELAKTGIQVRVVLTEGAQAFVAPLTFATLSRHPAYTDQTFWQPTHSRPLHIELGEWAELLLIAPLTANTLAKLAYGLADNLLTNTVLASTCPVLLAPAMNTDMWQQVSVQRNWQLIQTDPRYHCLNPHAGVLACDRKGVGRMAEPADQLAYIHSLLHTTGIRDLSGLHLLITMGGTREHLDPVRFIGNPATGKMGVALAQAALHRGATVTVIHAPLESHLAAQLSGTHQISVISAAEMHQAVMEYFPHADWTVMAAAVADVTPTECSPIKLPKHSLPATLPLTPAPDILSELGQQKQPHQRLIGFAAQTGDIVSPALDKLHRKKLDAIVANPIDQPDSGFGSDTNQAILINQRGQQLAIAPCPKLKLAHHLFDFIQGKVWGLELGDER